MNWTGEGARREGVGLERPWRKGDIYVADISVNRFPGVAGMGVRTREANHWIAAKGNEVFEYRKERKI